MSINVWRTQLYRYTTWRCITDAVVDGLLLQLMRRTRSSQHWLIDNFFTRRMLTTCESGHRRAHQRRTGRRWQRRAPSGRDSARTPTRWCEVVHRTRATGNSPPWRGLRRPQSADRRPAPTRHGSSQAWRDAETRRSSTVFHRVPSHLNLTPKHSAVNNKQPLVPRLSSWRSQTAETKVRQDKNRICD